MKQVPDRLILGKTSHFVKSRLSRLPRTDEVWEADIQPMSVSGWNARRHGELWLGMVLTRHMYLVMLAYSLLMGELKQGRAREWRSIG